MSQEQDDLRLVMDELVTLRQGPDLTGDGPIVIMDPGPGWSEVANYHKKYEDLTGLGVLIGGVAIANGLNPRHTAEFFAAAAEPPLEGVDRNRLITGAGQLMATVNMAQRAMSSRDQQRAIDKNRT
jgi:hypothetical protein